jgi:predicted amidohydrolase
MKICMVQTRPVKGDIQRNIENHKAMIELAIARGADIILFPELSITGYEPQLAKELATTQEDPRFAEFQEIADSSEVIIGIGAPTSTPEGICISMLLFHPQNPSQTYSKQYLHTDEEPFFIRGQNAISCLRGNPDIALAICYELSVPEHSQAAFRNGAKIYLASVAKTAEGMERASRSLSEIARKYSMFVLLSNCVGPCDNFESSGNSAIWENRGLQLGKLNNIDEGLLIFDLDTQEVTALTMKST